jgi:nickel transport protein
MPGRAAAVVALLALLVLTGGASGHELWLEAQGDTLTLLYGHTGKTHGEAELRTYSPDEVIRVECFDASGDTASVSVHLSYPVRIAGRPAVTYVLTSSGYWTKTPFGTKRQPKDETKSPLESWLSYESVKRIDTWGEGAGRPLTRDFEITPVKNPLKLDEGKKVRLLVTVHGEPLADVSVAYGGQPRGVTDSRGRINIRLRHGGLQLIQASFTEPADSVKTDEIVRTTTLVFVIE